MRGKLSFRFTGTTPDCAAGHHANWLPAGNRLHSQSVQSGPGIRCSNPKYWQPVVGFVRCSGRQQNGFARFIQDHGNNTGWEPRKPGQPSQPFISRCGVFTEMLIFMRKTNA